MIVKVVRIHPDAVLPTLGSTGAAGWDLTSYQRIEVEANGWATVPLGFAIEIPVRYFGMIASRSGLTTRGLVVANGAGIIDSDYRGEVKAVLRNRTHVPMVIEPGDRVAQILFLPVPPVTLLEMDSIDKLTRTDRGEAGFGSTGC